MAKCVRWGDVRVVEFRVGFNGCAVPSSEGPPVGLTDHVERASTFQLSNDPATIDEEDRRPSSQMSERYLEPMQRVQLLQSACGFDLHEIARMCQDARFVLQLRAESRRDFDVQDAFESGDLARLKILYELDLLPPMPQQAAKPETMVRAIASHIAVPA